MSNNSYFGGIAAGLKTLAIGMKTTMKEYFTPKSTEQYPENRKTTLHVSPRFRGRLVFVRDENEAYKCVGCTLCEKSCPNDTIKIRDRDGGGPRDRQEEAQVGGLPVRLGRLHVLRALCQRM